MLSFTEAQIVVSLCAIRFIIKKKKTETEHECGVKHELFLQTLLSVNKQ